MSEPMKIDLTKNRPPADYVDVAYGPHERNRLDLYLAKSKAPTPLVVHIHGGGFRGGDKAMLRASLVTLCQAAGISVAAVNYRLSQHALFPAAMHDGARAVQFLRANAKRWNLDPSRVAATGGSAGAGISLWLGYHKDLADPASDDPVARQSIRPTCMGVINAQSSYDLRFIARHIGQTADAHPALLDFFGLKPGQIDTPEARAMFAEASPIDFVSAGGPPVFMFYSIPDQPVTPETTQNDAIHHPTFGNLLKARLATFGIECIVRYGDEVPGAVKDEKIMNVDPEMVGFFRRHFGMTR